MRGNRIDNLRSLLVLLVILLAIPTLQATTGEAALDSAYKKGDYLKCVSLIRARMQTEGTSSSQYYNLGNAYSNAGNPGAAVLNYMIALRLDPMNSEADNNLKYLSALVQEANESAVGDKTLDTTPALPSFFRNIRNMIASVSSDVWAVSSVVAFIIVIMLLVVYFFVKKVSLRKLGFFGSGILLIMSILLWFFASISKSAALSADEGVLMINDVVLRSAPSDKSKQVAAPLSSGTVVRILEVTSPDKDDEGWTKIYLNSDYTGWIPSSTIEAVRVPELH